MICQSIDFALVVLLLLMFEVYGNIGILKTEFFNFAGTERVKQNQKKFKKIQISTKPFFIFHWQFNPFVLGILLERGGGDNTDLHSNNHISKTVKVNVTFTKCFFNNIQ